MRATSSRSSPSSSRSRFDSSTIANGSTNSVWPGVARVVDDPGHRAARARAHGDDGSAAALGDEIFLQMRLDVGIRGERAQPVAGAAPRGRELGAQRLELGRGGVLDARRIELERALELIGHAAPASRRSHPRVPRAAAPSSLRSPRCPRTPSAARAVSAIATRPSAPSAPPRPAWSASAAHVVGARHARRALLDEHQRLRAERLPRRDLGSVRRGQQGLGERAAGREGRVVGQPLANRGELEHVERVTVHQAAGYGADCVSLTRWIAPARHS